MEQKSIILERDKLYQEVWITPLQKLAINTMFLTFEIEALVETVDIKLRLPLNISLGSDGLQIIFASSRILTSHTVREQFQ
ncbi:MAG: hypothetical protein ACFFFT_05495 [Candidatus Thorarchaeota archaeon]